MLINAIGSQYCLIGLIVFLTVAGQAWANPDAQKQATTTVYNIPAGSLNDALKQFAQQSGIRLQFDAEKTKAMTTQGLTGQYGTPDGLMMLLMGSGLQATPQADGYVIKSSARAITPQAVTPTVLPPIQVTAGGTARYQATTSVTATKTNTLLRDVPQSISVVTRELIEDQSIQSLGDAVRYIPGVGVSQGEGNRDALIFRGNRSTGDFFVDGLRDDVQFVRDLYNMERIEVLKGANGMIFGRGGSGGVVNRVTKQANWNPTRSLSFEGGSYDRKRVTADVGHVLHDMVAVRLNGVFEDTGSYRDHVDLQRMGISPTFTIKPTKRTKIVLNMERFYDKRVTDRGIPSFEGRPVKVGRSQFFGNPDLSFAKVDVLAFNAFIEHKFDFGLTVNNRTNYAEYDKFYQNVFANSPVSATTQKFGLGAYNDTTDRQNIFNQTNFLYSLDTGPVSHTLLAGVEIGRQITDNVRLTGQFSGQRPGRAFRVPLSDPVDRTPITFISREGDADNYSVVDITSLYIQDQIEIIPQLQAVVGVRYDLFETDFRKRNGVQTELKTKDGLLAPRFGLIFKPIEPVSIYASYSQAFVPRAGEQLTSIVVTRATLKPEKFTTLELGFKWDIRPDLSLAGAAYRLDRSNVLSVDPTNSARKFLTKGQRTEGVEISISGQLTPKWSVMGGYAFQDGEITSTESNFAPKGNSVAELPRHTFSMWSRYDFTPKYGAALGIINRGDMFASTDNKVRVQGFTRVDAALFAKLSKRIRMQVNIQNLFDTKYIESVHNNNNATPGSPIAVRASITAKF